MRFTAIIASAVLAYCAVASPVDVERRATSCTITDVSQLTSAKSSCTTITIGNVAVPAGKTLDLTKLKTGTKVVFTGTVTFGYKEWEGPLVSVSGTNIAVSGQSGNLLDGNGAKWWDGKVRAVDIRQTTGERRKGGWRRKGEEGIKRKRIVEMRIEI